MLSCGVTLCLPSTDRVTFQPGSAQNVTISANETVQALLAAIPVDVAFATLQFHTRDHNATLSYGRVRELRQGTFVPFPGNTEAWRKLIFTLRRKRGSNVALTFENSFIPESDF